MYEIRNEVINAQKLFEEKSSNVSDIVSNIQLLKLMGYNEEARDFQGKFDKIWDSGSLSELEKLSGTIKYVLNRYQTFD